MGNDLFDPFEDEKIDVEIIEEITDEAIDSTPKKSWGKVIFAVLICAAVLGVGIGYYFQKYGAASINLGIISYKSNYTKDGKRYLVNSELPSGYEAVDLIIKDVTFSYQKTAKDDVQIEMIIALNYWPNQNYLDYQYRYHLATSNDRFDIGRMIKDFAD